MSSAQGVALIEAYYAAFNASDTEAMLALLADDVVHDICQGGREIGRARFAAFMAHMNECYREHLTDLAVMIDATGRRGAAEFTVYGTYLRTDPGVPEATSPARGQSYVLAAGAFFVLRDNTIARVSNHYNLADWSALLK